MAFVTYRDSGGRAWLVDTEGVKRLIWAYARAQAVDAKSLLTPEPQQMGFLGSFFPLTITTVQTDFTGVKGAVKSNSLRILGQLIPEISQSGHRAFESLISFRHQTIQLNNKFRRLQQTASAQTSEAVSRVNSHVEIAMTITKSIRDFSASFVMVGATVLSGGTMVAAVAGGSLMKGTFTFQDKKMAGGSTSDAIAEGAIETSFDFATGLITFGKGAIEATAVGAPLAKGTLVLLGATLDGTSEFAKATIDGKTARQALQAAGSRVVMDGVLEGVSGRLEAAFANPAMARWSFPITITRGSTKVVSLSETTLNSVAALTADHIVGALSDIGTTSGPSLHDSIAHTHLSQPNSDVFYVEQHAMRPANA